MRRGPRRLLTCHDASAYDRTRSTLELPRSQCASPAARPGTSSGSQTQRLPGVREAACRRTSPHARRRYPRDILSVQITEALPTVRTPVPSSLAGNTTRSSMTPPPGGAFSAAAALPNGGGGGWLGHPRWRFSFLSRDAEAARDATGSAAVADPAAAVASITGNADAESPTRMTAPSSSLRDGEQPDGASAARAESSRPRKGDVVCLSYRTLDDRGMRQLEGRSDHRPVIGMYAIYV